MKKRLMYNVTKIHHLADTMIMYGVYNSDILTDLIGHSTQNAKFHYLGMKKTFAGKLHDWMALYSQDEGFVQLCHKFCTISDYDTRKICKNV